MGFPYNRQWEQQRVPSDPKPVAPKGLGHLLTSARELTSVVKLQLEKWGLSRSRICWDRHWGAVVLHLAGQELR